MSFAATIMARLGLDTKGFSNGMRDANRDVDTHERRINNAGRAHDNLLRSNHRVARQMENFGKTLIAGGDAADIFATGLDGIGRSLNLSLGALAGIGIGAVVIGHIYKAVEAAHKLKKEIQQIGEDAGSSKFVTLDGLIARLEKIKVKTEELTAQHEKNVRALSGTPATARGLAAENREYEADKFLLDRTATSETSRAIADKRRQKNAIKGDKWAQFDPHNNDEYMEAATPGSPKENQLLAQVIAEELQKGLLELIHTIIQKAEDTSKLTMGQLAAGPGYGDQNHSSLKAIYDAEQARKAIALDKQGDDLMQNQGDLQGSMALHSQAEQIRNGIGGLKDSEKTHIFQDALDASMRLKSMDDKLGKRLVNR